MLALPTGSQPTLEVLAADGRLTRIVQSTDGRVSVVSDGLQAGGGAVWIDRDGSVTTGHLA